MAIDANKILTTENAADSTATIFLYGIIGSSWTDEDSITDIDFLKTLNDFAAKYTRIDIRGNCVGGSMKHGLAIITAIQTAQAKGIDLHIWNDGIMASMAADIFMAVKGKENRHAAVNSCLMVHNSMDSIYGNAKYLRDNVERVAKKLDQLTEGTISIMAQATGMTEEEVKAKYYADYEDHFLTAKEMLEIGLIEKIEDYASENVPTEPQKMGLQGLFSWFSANKKAAEPTHILDNAQNQEEEMTTEQMEQLAELVAAKMKPADTTQEPQKSAESEPQTPDYAAIIADAVKTAVEPLNAKIEELKVQKSGASTIKTQGDVGNDPNSLDAMKAAFEASQDEYAKAQLPFQRSTY